MLRVLKWVIAVGLLSGLVLLMPGGRERWLPGAASWLDVGELPVCTDYVLVLPGDEIGRPLMAASLIRLGMAREVLIPQNPESADSRDGITPPTAQISRRVLEQRGIPDDRIVLLPTQSRTTFDDAQALRVYLRNHAGDATVVTSAFHTRRAAFVFGKVFQDEAIQIHFVSAPNPGFTSSDWWTRPEGARLIITEYAKLAYYWTKFGDKRLLAVVLAVWCGYRVVRCRKRRLNAGRAGLQMRDSGGRQAGELAIKSVR